MNSASSVPFAQYKERNEAKPLLPAKVKPDPVFGRPALANEVFANPNKKKFDKLPGWKRHFIQRMIETGNWGLAAREADVANQVEGWVPGPQNKVTIVEAFERVGINPHSLANVLMGCLEAKTARYDSKGNKIGDSPNHQVRIKAVEMAFRLLGSFEPPPPVDAVPRDDKGILELFESST